MNNPGIQRMEDLTSGQVTDAEATVTTNLSGPIRLTAALLPFLLTKPEATILNVTSTWSGNRTLWMTAKRVGSSSHRRMNGSNESIDA